STGYFDDLLQSRRLARQVDLNEVLAEFGLGNRHECFGGYRHERSRFVLSEITQHVNGTRWDVEPHEGGPISPQPVVRPPVEVVGLPHLRGMADQGARILPRYPDAGDLAETDFLPAPPTILGDPEATMLSGIAARDEPATRLVGRGLAGVEVPDGGA